MNVNCHCTRTHNVSAVNHRVWQFDWETYRLARVLAGRYQASERIAVALSRHPASLCATAYRKTAVRWKEAPVSVENPV